MIMLSDPAQYPVDFIFFQLHITSLRRLSSAAKHGRLARIKHLALYLTPHYVQVSECQKWCSLISFVLSIYRSQRMNIQCPNCHSARITTRTRARKTAGLIGTVGGCVGGATGSLSGIEIGMTVGVVAGPPGMVFGGVLGALFGAVVGGTAGGLSGARLGELVDRRILYNYRCLACGHCFSLTVSE